MNWPKEYIVDITKPPIFPPNIEMIDRFFITTETKESIRQTKMWNEYLAEYNKQLTINNEKINAQ